MSGIARFGKGKGKGKGGMKRFRTKQAQVGLNNQSIRRLARRGGVKRISGLMYEETRRTARAFLRCILTDAITYSDYRQAKTVTAGDVLHALKRNNFTLYGFDH